LRLYTARAPLIWNSYAAFPTLDASHGIPRFFGFPMKHRSGADLANPYSPLICGLLLLLVFAAIEAQVVF